MRLNNLCVVLGAAAFSTGCPSDPEVLDALGGTGTPETTGAESDDGTTPLPADDGEDEDTGEMTSDDGPAGPFCGNDIIDGDDFCDGTDLAGYTCQVLGFETGELGCTVNCGGHDLTGCGFFECGNGKEEGEEDCDGTVGDATCASEGFDNGTLFCTPECEYNFEQCGTCGDRLIGPAEDCDIAAPLEASCQSLGLLSGTLQCGDDCLFDLSNCSTCGNDEIDGAEDCDGKLLAGETCLTQGFDSGELSCTACNFQLSGCGECGNGIADGDELCDGLDVDGDTCVDQGFDSGALSCNATCDAIDLTSCGNCGNGAIDGSESCDGALLGGSTCAGLGLEGGDLGCNAGCQYDFSGCDLQGTPFGSDSFYTGLEIMPGVLPCDEISATGVNTGAGDDTQLVVAMGFDFNFYGTAFSDVTVSSNGTLNFNDPFSPGLGNSCFPNALDPYLIAVFHDDLDPPDGVNGGVWTQTIGPVGNQRFVVQWDTPHFIGDANDLIRVQVMLHEAGNIDVCYVDTINGGNAGDNGAQATAGIGLDGVDSVQYSCNTPDLVDGLQLMYVPL